MYSATQWKHTSLLSSVVPPLLVGCVLGISGHRLGALGHLVQEVFRYLWHLFLTFCVPAQILGPDKCNMAYAQGPPVMAAVLLEALLQSRGNGSPYPLRARHRRLCLYTFGHWPKVHGSGLSIYRLEYFVRAWLAI